MVMDDAFPADPPEPIPPRTRARWAAEHRRCDEAGCQDSEIIVEPDHCVLCCGPWPCPTTRLLAALAEAERMADAEMLRAKACEHIAEGDEGWEQLRNECPSTVAVARLRDRLVVTQAALNEKCLEGERYRQEIADGKEKLAEAERELDETRGLAARQTAKLTSATAERDDALEAAAQAEARLRTAMEAQADLARQRDRWRHLYADIVQVVAYGHVVPRASRAARKGEEQRD